MKYLLAPLSLPYSAIMTIRNFMFDKNIFFSEKSYPLPIISIGNITVGGTGKTPHTEYLTSLLLGNTKIATLSRGYGRNTKGYRCVKSDGTAEDFGDEPLQMKQKFPSLPVHVCEDRRTGIEMIIHQDPATECILLDDAYQHRHVKPSLSILLIDYNRPLWKDFPFPAGLLREPRIGKKRADIIIISKCPEESKIDREKIIHLLKPGSGQKVFFSSISYGTFTNFRGKEAAPDQMHSAIAVTGIAQSDAFVKHLQKKFSDITHIHFGDHHNFTLTEIERIKQALHPHSQQLSLITTEKDYVRLLPFFSNKESANCFYLPIKTQFLFGQKDEFDKTILKHIESFSVK